MVSSPTSPPPMTMLRTIKYPPSHRAALAHSVEVTAQNKVGEEEKPIVDDYVTSLHETLSKVSNNDFYIKFGDFSMVISSIATLNIFL